MADQQFLASFGVDIDESGVSRLQKILAENRTLADSLSASFEEPVRRVCRPEDRAEHDGTEEGDRLLHGEREEADPADSERVGDRVCCQDGDGKRSEFVLRDIHPECPGGNEYGPEVRRAFLPAGQPESG